MERNVGWHTSLVPDLECALSDLVEVFEPRLDVPSQQFVVREFVRRERITVANLIEGLGGGGIRNSQQKGAAEVRFEWAGGDQQSLLLESAQIITVCLPVTLINFLYWEPIANDGCAYMRILSSAYVFVS